MVVAMVSRTATGQMTFLATTGVAVISHALITMILASTFQKLRENFRPGRTCSGIDASSRAKDIITTNSPIAI